MKEKLVNDLQAEVKSLEETLKGARDKYSELEKATTNAGREILVLEGRLAEVKAIIEHINSIEEETDDVEE